MNKMVIYNGETASYYPCDDPAALVVGKMYEVRKEKVSDWHTEYELRGVKGEFNSVWFNEVQSYFACTKTIPQKGEVMEKFVRWNKAKRAWENFLKSSRILEVKQLSSDMYKVQTQNTLYIVQIIG